MAVYTTRRVLSFYEKSMKPRKIHHFFDLSSAGVIREGWCNGLFVCTAITTTLLPLGATDNSILLTLADARRQRSSDPRGPCSARRSARHPVSCPHPRCPRGAASGC